MRCENGSLPGKPGVEILRRIHTRNQELRRKVRWSFWGLAKHFGRPIPILSASALCFNQWAFTNSSQKTQFIAIFFFFWRTQFIAFTSLQETNSNSFLIPLFNMHIHHFNSTYIIFILYTQPFQNSKFSFTETFFST